jgi:hypothetical protein
MNTTTEVADTPGAASSSGPAIADAVTQCGSALTRCGCRLGRKQCGVWFRRGRQPGGKPQGGQLADRCPACSKAAPIGICRCFCWECNYPDVWDPTTATSHLPPSADGHCSAHPEGSSVPMIDLSGEPLSDEAENDNDLPPVSMWIRPPHVVHSVPDSSDSDIEELTPGEPLRTPAQSETGHATTTDTSPQVGAHGPEPSGPNPFAQTCAACELRLEEDDDGQVLPAGGCHHMICYTCLARLASDANEPECPTCALLGQGPASQWRMRRGPLQGGSSLGPPDTS